MKSEKHAILHIQIDEQSRSVSLAPDMLDHAGSILLSMDRDMSGGWKLSRKFITNPTVLERCQIAADRLLTALHNGNEPTTSLMSAYILTRLPNVKTVLINTEGESDQTMFYDQDDQLIT